MKSSLLFFALLLCALSAKAQQPVQTVYIDANGASTVAVHLADTLPGQLITCFCWLGNSGSITDSQINQWQQANADYNGIQYVGASKGGAETVYITSQDSSPGGFILVWPGRFKLKDVIPSRNLPTVPTQSLSYVDNTTTPSSFPLTTTGTNELVLGYGLTCSISPAPSPVTAGPSWTMAAIRGCMMLQYMTVPTPSTIVSSFVEPLIPEGTYVNEGIVAFEPVSAPITQQVTVNLKVTYDDGTVPIILALALTDTTANPNVQQFYLVPDPVTGLASASFTLSSADTYSGALYLMGAPVASLPFQGGPILALMPQISNLNWTVILCKTSCPAGAVKELVTDTR
jgi:hypothetical protein